MVLFTSLFLRCLAQAEISSEISERWNGERGERIQFTLFMSYALYGMMAYCAFMDIRYYRIPNRALEAVAAAGLAVSAEACVSGAGSVGFWAAAAEGVVVFIMGLVLAAAAGFPFFLLRMVGAGDIKFMALVAGCFGLERGFWSVVIGLCLGAVLALGKMLREGSVCQRFLYLTAYIRRLIQSKEIEAYYCPERDGYKCVIPLGACFFAGTLISVLWKG